MQDPQLGKHRLQLELVSALKPAAGQRGPTDPNGESLCGGSAHTIFAVLRLAQPFYAITLLLSLSPHISQETHVRPRPSCTHMTVAVRHPWTCVQALRRDPFPLPERVQGKLPGDGPSSRVQKGERPLAGDQGGERQPRAEEQYVQRHRQISGALWGGEWKAGEEARSVERVRPELGPEP